MNFAQKYPALAEFLVFATALTSGAVACTLLGPDKTAITEDAAQIAKCQAAGRACQADGGVGCYAVYDACITDAGLR